MRQLRAKTIRSRASPCRGFARQICACPRVVVQQPQHAARNCSQQPHRDVEKSGAILYALLKQQKIKPSSGKPHSVRDGVCSVDGPSVVVTLAAVRQVHQPLAEESLLIVRQRQTD